MLICDLPLRPVPKLPPEPTLAAQRRRSDFSAGGVPQIVLFEVDLESKVVVGMDHFCAGLSFSSPLS